MEIDSACGCKITITAEDLDKNRETDGKWLLSKMTQHIMWEHAPIDKPITQEQVQAMGKAILEHK